MMHIETLLFSRLRKAREFVADELETRAFGFMAPGDPMPKEPTGDSDVDLYVVPADQLLAEIDEAIAIAEARL